MDILLFRDLEHLSQTGNFSQAASKSNLSQPAFSRRIKALEAWVGTTLVNRSRQPVKLTPSGEQMLEAGLQALARIEHEREQILELESVPGSSIVSFGTQHSIGWRFYPSWLQALEQAYGPVLSQLRADDLPNCMQDLKEGNVDFVIAYASGATKLSRQLDSITIGEDQLIPVCKPSSDGSPLFTFDAQGVKLPFLRFGETAPIAAHLNPLFTQNDISTSLQTVYENSMAGALRIRARAGDGVAWLPRSLVSPDLDNGLLVHTGEADWVVDLSIQLLRSKDRSNKTTRAIWSFLETRQSTPLVCL
ncbi:MAG: LysR family transcriptional regulator [Granulosicoccaceae bacterium]